MLFLGSKEHENSNILQNFIHMVQRRIRYYITWSNENTLVLRLNRKLVKSLGPDHFYLLPSNGRDQSLLILNKEEGCCDNCIIIIWFFCLLLCTLQFVISSTWICGNCFHYKIQFCVIPVGNKVLIIIITDFEDRIDNIQSEWFLHIF